MKVFYKKVSGNKTPSECIHSPLDVIYPSCDVQTKTKFNIGYIFLGVALFAFKFKLMAALSLLGVAAYFIFIKDWERKPASLDDLQKLSDLKKFDEIDEVISTYRAASEGAQGGVLHNKDLVSLCNQINREIKKLEAKSAEKILSDLGQRQERQE